MFRAKTSPGRGRDAGDYFHEGARRSLYRRDRLRRARLTDALTHSSTDPRSHRPSLKLVDLARRARGPGRLVAHVFGVVIRRAERPRPRQNRSAAPPSRPASPSAEHVRRRRPPRRAPGAHLSAELVERVPCAGVRPHPPTRDARPPSRASNRRVALTRRFDLTALPPPPFLSPPPSLPSFFPSPLPPPSLPSSPPSLPPLPPFLPSPPFPPPLPSPHPLTPPHPLVPSPPFLQTAPKSPTTWSSSALAHAHHAREEGRAEGHRGRPLARPATSSPPAQLHAATLAAGPPSNLPARERCRIAMFLAGFPRRSPCTVNRQCSSGYRRWRTSRRRSRGVRPRGAPGAGDDDAEPGSGRGA